MKVPTRILSVVLAIMMLFVSLPAMAEGSTDVIRETTPVYLFDSKTVGQIETVYLTAEKDILYISGTTVAMILRSVSQLYNDAGYVLTSYYTTYDELEKEGKVTVSDDIDKSTKIFVLERENGALVLLDAENDMIWMSDRDKFFVSSYAVSGGDLVSADGLYYENGERDESKIYLFRRAGSGQFTREGDVTVVDLSSYGITMKTIDGELYLPAATVSDLILPAPMIFNGEAMFISNGSLDDNAVNDDGLTMKELYYRPGTRDRSDELIGFNYDELCLMLDQCYGLKTEHGITTTFDEYFQATGLVNGLLSRDITEYNEALNQLMRGYFGDMHSGVIGYSSYSGSEVDIDTTKNRSVSVSEYIARSERFSAARDAAGVSQDGQIVNGYTEVGDTAFITFDSFIAASQNYYSSDLWSDFSDIYMSDTISLVIYSQKMIHREDSPIRQVVIDLSLNGGGSVDACMYVAAWVLGTATLSVEDVRTGAQYTTRYWVDTDLNGRCTDDDDLGVDKLDVYCLISGNSFSCGNLLPSIFKEDGRVTLVGQASGGGSCIVRNTSAADGTLLAISDYFRLSIVKNGSFYGIDEGVEPDIPLRKYASYYDREALAEYLKTLR